MGWYRLIAVVTAVAAAGGCATENANRGHAGRASDLAPVVHAAGPTVHSSPLASVKRALRRVYVRWGGTPYRYGGRTQQGVDCSSFVRQAVDTAESFELPRTTAEQVQVGDSIPRSDLEAGDLVFFKTGRRSRHVGVYLGDDRFMHASSSQGVTISRLDNIYWRNHYWQSRRITDVEQTQTGNNRM